jgi:peptide/nickel transport system substrate-binding protein
MNRRDRLALLALAALLAVVGAAMLLPGPSAGGPSGAPPSAVTYREAIVGHPSSVNPLTARTQVDRDVVALVFEGLVRIGPDGSLVPGLASTWTVSPDGRSYTFFLNSQDRWHDGRPVTADDVVFTVGLAADPDYDGPLGAAWQGVEATAVSTHVVRITLPAPLGGFLRMATLPLLPEHLLAGVSISDLADSAFSARPIGSGPFRLDGIDVTHAVLSRVQPAAASASENESSPAGSSAAASPSTSASGSAGSVERPIGVVEMHFYDTEEAAAAAYVGGDVDAVSGLRPDTIETATARAGSELARYPWASLTAVVLNQRETHPELAVKSVRQALLSAIDRPTAVADVLAGRGSVADAPLPPWSSWYDKDAVTEIPYAGQGAEAGLASAGWAQGRDGWMLPGTGSAYIIRLLTLDEATNPTLYRIAQRVASDWRAIGLQVALVTATVGDYRQALQNGQFQAAVVEYRLGLDPDISPLLLSTQAAPVGANLSGVSDQTLDRLLQSVRTTFDQPAREAAVAALETYVTSNVLMLPLCFTDYGFVVSDRVSGRSEAQISDPSDRYWDVLDWRLASDG